MAWTDAARQAAAEARKANARTRGQSRKGARDDYKQMLHAYSGGAGAQSAARNQLAAAIKSQRSAGFKPGQYLPSQLGIMAATSTALRNQHRKGRDASVARTTFTRMLGYSNGGGRKR